ncbi:MAG: [Alphaproteobacteria bacterium]|nr:[FeFe] hydrogenase H-cluster maturation GTPase HydF [Alphaproteobacteria bacterium]
MQSAPKSLRLHIALLGRVNAGKSSFLNLVTGQDVSITSAIAGTTTDVVEKTQELLPIGPVVWLDTAGLGDETALGEKRLAKTQRILDKADVALLICDGSKWGEEEETIIAECEKRKIPLIKVHNKADLSDISGESICVNSTDKSSRDRVLNELKEALIKVVPEDFIQAPALLGDLVPPHSTIILLTPIDKEAPKGRLIMPQVQAIRDALDHDNIVIVVKETEYVQALNSLKNKPDLVVCDSQVVDFMISNTPEDILCTTFSILFARLKGDLLKMAEGAEAINRLQDGDKVLIAEACTHHAIDDDIGKVKIPNGLKKKTGKNLQFDFCSGCTFPDNLQEYKLVVQCGGCTQNRREILSRIQKCESARVAITNYGICLSEVKGVLDRVVEVFVRSKP